MRIDKISNEFIIKRVNKTSDEDYIKALKIYNDTTPYEIKTNSNEITYWIQKSRENNNPFEVIAFVLYFNDKVIGLSMTTYIKNSKIVIDEYLATYDQFRVNTVFLIYFSLIQNYYSTNNFNVSYYVTEISNKEDGKAINKESRISIKILCLEDFGKIDAPYYVLPLGLDNYESSFQAFLYIKSNDNMPLMNNVTYLNIVHSIYYDYFYNWYMPLMTPENLDVYKNQIDIFYDKIQNNLLKNKTSNVKILTNACSVLENYKDDTSGALPQIRSKKRNTLILFTFIILLPLFIIIVYTYVLKYLRISLDITIGSICSAVIASITTFIISKKK